MVLLTMMSEINKSGRCANAHIMMENMHELDERFEWLSRFYGAKDAKAVENAALVISADLLELLNVALTQFP